MPKLLTATRPTGHPAGMAGIAFRSVLAPHLEYVRQRRRARATWKEIADELTARGVKTSPSNVCEVFRRAMARKTWPAGMEPVAQVSAGASTPDDQGEAGAVSMFATGKRRTRKPEASAPTAKPRPYRSRLEQHLPFIKEQRRAGMGWRQIAEALGKLGAKVSFQAVQDYFSRSAARDAKAAAETAQPPSFGPIHAPTAPVPFQAPTGKPRNVPPPEADPLAGAGLD